jgi:hypothetical protein
MSTHRSNPKHLPPPKSAEEYERELAALRAQLAAAKRLWLKELKSSDCEQGGGWDTDAEDVDVMIAEEVKQCE